MEDWVEVECKGRRLAVRCDANGRSSLDCPGSSEEKELVCEETSNVVLCQCLLSILNGAYHVVMEEARTTPVFEVDAGVYLVVEGGNGVAVLVHNPH